MKWLFVPLVRTFDFSGRSSRKEFWLFALTYVIAQIMTEIIDTILFGAPAILTLLLLVIFLIPSFSIWIRRLHDIGWSGWWLLLGLTIIGLIVPLVLALLPSQPGVNKYGPNPYNSANIVDSLQPQNSNPKREYAQALPQSNQANVSAACGNCGKSFISGAKFCTNCGSTLQ